MSKKWLLLLLILVVMTPVPVRATDGQHGTPHKVLLLGLDGATWRVLLPMMNAGMLPNLSRLFRNGIHGTLFSQDAFSPISWNNIYTGTGKNRHGIRELYRPDNLGCSFLPRNVDYPPKLHSASFDRRSIPLWKIVSEAGKRVGVMFFLNTYPADDVNGIFVSGDSSPNLLSNTLVTERLLRVSEPTEKVRRFKGSLFGSEVSVEETTPGHFTVRYPDHPDCRFGDLTENVMNWFPVRLDGEPETFFATPTDIKPLLSPAHWKNQRQGTELPLQITLFSGITPRHHYHHHNRPLFLFIDQPHVRFAYDRDVNLLQDAADIFGIPVQARIISLSGLSAAGEIRLIPDLPNGIPLTLRWQPEMKTASRTVTLSMADDDPQAEDPWVCFIQWVMRNRRLQLKTPTAFEGLAKGRMSVSANHITFHVHSVFDSFTQPAYRFFSPPDLFRTLDTSRFEGDLFAEIYRNHRIKKVLFDHVFDPEQFDFFMLCYTATDTVQHFPWNSPDPLDREVSNNNQLIINRWLEIDDYVRELLQRLPSDWIIVAASDHGFNKVDIRRRININWNQVLDELGLLKTVEPNRTVAENIPFQPERQTAHRVTTVCRCREKPDFNLFGDFVLLNPDGRFVASLPWFPGNGAYPSFRWQAGAEIRSEQEIIFDEGVRPGTYQLQLRPIGNGALIDVIDLGPITIPDTPHSLIPPEGLMRIGDVEVTPMNRNHKGIKPVTMTAGIDFVDWKIEAVPNRSLGFLDACQRTVTEDSVAAYFSGGNLEGIRVHPPGIYLLGKVGPQDQALLSDIADMLRSFRIVGSDTSPITDVRVMLKKRCVSWTINDNAYGPETIVRNVAFLTYDAQAEVDYKFRGRSVRRPLRELVFSQCNGFHENEGIYAIVGDTVANRGIGPQAVDWDITPTILDMLGIAVPAGLDGAPVPWLSGTGEDHTTDEEITSREELYEQLKSIGYLDNL